MTSLVLNNVALMPGRQGAPLCDVAISDGLIKSIGSDGISADGVIDFGGDYLCPGFFDVQVNGGGSVLFNDTPDVDTIRTIGAAHRSFGTTSFLPTLISDDLDVIDRAMRAVEDAITAGVPGVVGIHIEGPFLNVRRKGIHDASKFAQLTDEAIRLLSSLEVGRTLVTLAPECCRLEDIEALQQRGVVISAGHTDATYEQMTKALDAGVTGFTHLYNAMSPLHHREPGVVGAALDSQTAYCGLIADGHHVSAAALRIALRARPLDRFVLVTDAMPGVGTSLKRFALSGQTIMIKDGLCVDESGTLAGSNLDMASAVRQLVEMTDVEPAAAIAMATANPAQFMGLAQSGTIRKGSRADLVRLDRQLALKQVWQGGQPVLPEA
ncbi:N-acetylglucosamine-6-phosphate deacetylase [Parvularcula sp. LCG005]|uniref:N-acetylglucosamine-6-phosphate deacetylase n=1 Tax=Parvularcula sp. LCG005 TaxID=3078805 RepID=UPI002943A84B|nr:N-acetylglucosamine-6-phosphate deacetylase [Parvularcula sp. LCG005]WOI53654.1 N-acetylglucosamine-6-phosphate deacetylase [Parvularcula sp. LCG005]